MFKENNLSKTKKSQDSQLNLYVEFDKVDASRSPEEILEGVRKRIEIAEINREEKRRYTLPDKFAKLRGKSFQDIAEEAKKEEAANQEKLKQTREEIKNETEYKEKPISEDDDFIEPYSPAEEYYGRWK